MNRYFALSSALHLVLALLVIWLLSPSAGKPKATYTIDFIGSGKVVAVQQAPQPAASAPAPAKTEPKKEIAQPQPPKPEPAKKPAKKAYQSKTEISAKKQPKKKAAPLAAPSILDEAKTDGQKPSSTQSADGRPAGSEVQTLTDFPYPWYIQQVRNSLWSEWEKRRPAGVTRGAMVSFAIARDGKVKDLDVSKSSGDDAFDFAAKSAVINAGPFPPLPMYYEKDELTVTVEFKQEA